MENRWHYVSDEKIYNYALSDATPYTLGYLMCSKSATNKKFLLAFDRALSTWKQTEQFRHYHRLSANYLSDLEFNALFDTAFTEQSK